MLCRSRKNDLPNAGELQLLISGADEPGYVDDFLVYPVCDPDFAALQTIHRIFRLPERIALNFRNEELFQEFFYANTDNDTGSAAIQDGHYALRPPQGVRHIFIRQKGRI